MENTNNKVALEELFELCGNNDNSERVYLILSDKNVDLSLDTRYQVLNKALSTSSFDIVQTLLSDNRFNVEYFQNEEFLKTNFSFHNSALLTLLTHHEYFLSKVSVLRGIINLKDFNGLEKLISCAHECCNMIFEILLSLQKKGDVVEDSNFYVSMSVKYPHLKDNVKFNMLCDQNV